MDRSATTTAEIIGLNINETFTQATLHFKDASFLQFEDSKEMGSWTNASIGQNIAKEVDQALLNFELNSTYLWLHFDDGSQLRFRDTSVVMPPERRTLIMASITLLIIACMPILGLILRDSWSVNTWIGLIIGFGLGSPFIIKSMRSKDIEDKVPQKVPSSQYQFLVKIILLLAITVITLISIPIWVYLGETGQEMVYMILAGLVTSMMASLAFFIWRHLPEDQMKDQINEFLQQQES